MKLYMPTKGRTNTRAAKRRNLSTKSNRQGWQPHKGHIPVFNKLADKYLLEQEPEDLLTLQEDLEHYGTISTETLK